MVSELAAKKWAAVASVVVGALAVALVVVPGVRDFEFAGHAYERRTVVERVEKDAPDGRTVTVTSKPAEDSTLDVL